MKVKQRLRELGVKPVGGQHFLESDAVAEALVEAVEPEGQKIVEVGSGTGFITEKLLDRAEEVVAVEKDQKLAEHLQELFGDDIEVLHEDFLQTEIECDRYTGNIPFEISSDIIEKIGREQVQSALIVQKQLAEKAVADPGDSMYGFFTLKLNYYFIPVKLREVNSSNFYPEPDVDAAILKLYPNKERHGVEDEEKFMKVSKALFTHKRKKLRNAFVDARHILDFEKEEAKEVRDDLPNSEKRVINLSIKELSEISNKIAEI